MKAKRKAETGKRKEPPRPPCRCGLPSHPVYADTHAQRCENCWADDCERWHGHDQSVRVFTSADQGVTYDRR